jgi:siroheme synthase (precorrin-2 oxidase/ferrochelatase)
MNSTMLGGMGVIAPQTTAIADAIELLKAVSNPVIAAEVLDEMHAKLADIASTQADVNAKLADLARREEALQATADNNAKAAADLAAAQAAYEAKAAALKAALAG